VSAALAAAISPLHEIEAHPSAAIRVAAKPRARERSPTRQTAKPPDHHFTKSPDHHFTKSPDHHFTKSPDPFPASYPRPTDPVSLSARIEPSTIHPF
jgi:hypothetical protein